LTVLRLIPSRAAISRCELPFAAIVLTSAHSNALRTSRALLARPVKTGSSVEAQAVVIGAASGALFAARLRRSIGLLASRTTQKFSQPGPFSLSNR
jgi:hypothetical protein